MIAHDTKLIAVCGADGSGKSTLVNAMERANLLPDCAYVRRSSGQNGNRELVETMCPRPHGDGRDWIEGPFAEIVGVALAYDFLAHYAANISPRLGRSSVLVSDRYALCYEAYLKSIGASFRVDALFGGVRRPDLVLLVDAPIALSVDRCRKRGAVKDDEDPLVQERFRQAYLELLAGSYAPWVRIDNSGEIGASLDSIATHLAGLTR